MAIRGFFQKLYTFSLIPTTILKNIYYYLQFTYEKIDIHKDTSLSQSNLTYDPLYHPNPTHAKAEADAKACMQVVYLGRGLRSRI